jgi:alpha-tubulin suppressor-like RCC1 family protein
MANELRVWGDNSSQQISGAPEGHFKVIAGGSINGLALFRDKRPVLWGKKPNPPPPNAPGAEPLPAALQTEKFDGAALGRDDAVLIRQDGTLVAFGQKASIKNNVPAGRFRAVTVGALHAVAIAKDDGTLTAWGSNDGFGLTDLGLLNPPAGGPFEAVSAVVLYSLALHQSRKLYFWGRAPDASAPEPERRFLNGWTPTAGDPKILTVPGEFTAIAGGNIHALAIKPDKTVTGWGTKEAHGLEALTPPADVLFQAVDAGWGFSIGLDTNDTLWGWGKPVKSPFATQAWDFADLQGWTQSENGGYYVPNERFSTIAAAAFHIMAITAGN